MPRRPLCKAKYCYCTITLGWLEFSNVGFIVIVDAEMDAKEDGEDKKEEDKKNDANKDMPATSLERKKRKRKNTRTTAQRQKKKKEKEANSKTDN